MNTADIIINFLIFLITAAENTIGLWIIGVRHPLLIGILIGVSQLTAKEV